VNRPTAGAEEEAVSEQERKDRSDPADPDGDERDETPFERADRNWDELMQELRVTQTGIQILSGFLLTLPFQQRFTQLDDPLRALFLTAVALATVSTGLVVAPVAWHRLAFRKGRKVELVEAANRLAKTGLLFIGVTVIAVLALVFGVVLGQAAAVLAGVAALLVFGLLWLVLPLTMLRGVQRGSAAGSHR
jgi:MFS family permease